MSTSAAVAAAGAESTATFSQRQGNDRASMTIPKKVLKNTLGSFGYQQCIYLVSHITQQQQQQHTFDNCGMINVKNLKEHKCRGVLNYIVLQANSDTCRHQGI